MKNCLATNLCNRKKTERFPGISLLKINIYNSRTLEKTFKFN
jgi:hypothetical protein